MRRETNRKSETLEPIIVQLTAAGTQIICDKYKAYGGIINRNGNNYTWSSSTRSFIDPISRASTNNVNRLYGVAKALYNGEHRPSSEFIVKQLFVRQMDYPQSHMQNFTRHFQPSLQYECFIVRTRIQPCVLNVLVSFLMFQCNLCTFF